MALILDPFYFIEGRYMLPKGGKGGSAKAPDPQQTAAAQTAMNKDLALWNSALNNVNQITPYGNLTWTLGNATSTPGQSTSTSSAGYNTPTQSSSNMYVGPDGRVYDTSDATSFWQKYYTNNQGKSPIGGAVPGILGKDLNEYLTQQGFKALGGNSGTSASVSGSGTSSSGFNADGTPQWTSTITLSPEQQAILDSQNRQDIALGLLGEDQIGRIRDSVSTPYSYDGLAGGFTADDIATQQSNAEAALMARLNPQFAQDEEALRSRLINQGIGQGSQAYQKEIDAFNQAKNDARTQAVLAGQTYGSNAQQQALQRRNQAIQEYNAQRNAPLNEYIGLTSGVQVQNPTFSSGNYSGAQGVDYAGLVNQNYQNQIAQQNAATAAGNNTMSSLFGLGGSFLGAAGQAGGFGQLLGKGAGAASLFSDKRLKTDIREYDTKNGYRRYKFRYIDSDKEYIGVLAQEIKEVNKDAVSVDGSGFYKVDYEKLGFPMEEV